MISNHEFAALLDQTREFRKNVVDPKVTLWERERRVAPEALGAAAELGLLRLEVTMEHGEHATKLEAAQLLSDRAEIAVADGAQQNAVLTAAHAKKFATEIQTDHIARTLKATYGSAE